MINERGEFVRTQSAPERKESTEEKIFNMYSGMLTQNNHPDLSQQPEDVFYWKGDRLANIKIGIEELEALASQNNITEIINPWNKNEKVDLGEFVSKVRRSISYSEQVGE